LAWVALLAALASACAEERAPAASNGRIELSVVSVTDQGLRYRVFGNYTLRGLQNGVLTSVSSADDSQASVVRRELPSGLYSVALDAGFVLRPLDASGTPASAWPAATPLDGAGNEAPTATQSDATRPQLVVVEPGKVAQVQLRSVLPASAVKAQLAQR
jgi:hypothetical protein